MPKNIRVTYRCGATVNLGDFNNVKPEFEISADIEEGETPTQVKNRLKSVADTWLEEAFAEVGKKMVVKA